MKTLRQKSFTYSCFGVVCFLGLVSCSPTQNDPPAASKLTLTIGPLQIASPTASPSVSPTSSPSASPSASPSPSPTPPDPTATFTLSPTTGGVGTLLTITSTKFDFTTVLSVSVDGTTASIVSRSVTSMDVLVMPAGYTPLANAQKVKSGQKNLNSVTYASSLEQKKSAKKAKRSIASAVSSVSFTTAAGTYVYDADQSFTANRTSSVLTPIANQQGAKLSVQGGNVGCGVAIAADGNTLVTGGCYYPNGGAYIFTRSGVTWTRQGSKLLGTGAMGDARQGESVSMSADGKTLVIGGPEDDSQTGATWVFVRSGNTWSQQGTKLVGTNGAGAKQGGAVALSADGNTFVVGGAADSSGRGAIWIFKRTNGSWAQFGAKLTPSDGTANPLPQFGTSVAVSANGDTVLVGGIGDAYQGAAWVFTRDVGTYVQQGTKLVGTGAVGNAMQGYSVALSADGNTAAVGGAFDDTRKGAAWIFKRSSGVWSQEGSKLVATGMIGTGLLGYSIALSADGDLAVVGANGDDINNSEMGATWIFGRSLGTWSQLGTKLVGTGYAGFAVGQGFRVAISADGSTAAVSANKDDNNTRQGAVWIFVP